MTQLQAAIKLLSDTDNWSKSRDWYIHTPTMIKFYYGVNFYSEDYTVIYDISLIDSLILFPFFFRLRLKIAKHKKRNNPFVKKVSDWLTTQKYKNALAKREKFLMKILNKGRDAHNDLFVGDCKLCGCKVECTREETDFIPRGRFKAYRLKGKCPNPKCTWHIWVDHKKPDKKKGFFARLFNLLLPMS